MGFRFAMGDLIHSRYSHSFEEIVSAGCKRRIFELAEGMEMDFPDNSNAFVEIWRIWSEAQVLEQGQRVVAPTKLVPKRLKVLAGIM